eukprot:SAG11_NODE_2940_length_2822_cov_3.719060_2_plen_251_part_00
MLQGLCGAAISALQIYLFEQHELGQLLNAPPGGAQRGAAAPLMRSLGLISGGGAAMAALLGYGVALFTFYSLAPLLLARRGAVFFNLSLLTAVRLAHPDHSRRRLFRRCVCFARGMLLRKVCPPTPQDFWAVGAGWLRHFGASVPALHSKRVNFANAGRYYVDARAAGIGTALFGEALRPLYAVGALLVVGGILAYNRQPPLPSLQLPGCGSNDGTRSGSPTASYAALPGELVDGGLCRSQYSIANKSTT